MEKFRENTPTTLYVQRKFRFYALSVPDEPETEESPTEPAEDADKPGSAEPPAEGDENQTEDANQGDLLKIISFVLVC